VSRRSRRPDWADWADWDFPKPRRPADGIKARTQRGTFGATWWAGRWLAALERLVGAGRLSRGRSYARSGQVTRLDVGAGGVDARVQGSRPTPYRVTIHFRRLTEAEWAAVADAMAAEALYAARLLSGEMPERIEDAFRAAGVTLFPTDVSDLETDCTCPDWANPCKHVAAVHYLLGERFDADPFLIFVLRGRTRQAIVEALRARRGSGSAAAGETPEAPPAEAAEDATPPLAESLGAFWSSAVDLADFHVTFDAPPLDALPVKRLGPACFWQGPGDFEALMEARYRAIGTHAYDLAIGDHPGDRDVARVSAVGQTPGATEVRQAPRRSPSPVARASPVRRSQRSDASHRGGSRQ
jgi:uncharacterized Zn finger protein